MKKSCALLALVPWFIVELYKTKQIVFNDILNECALHPKLQNKNNREILKERNWNKANALMD